MVRNQQVHTKSGDAVLPISSSHATLLRAGGKGANLAQLTLAGFNVPPGFILTTDAYRAFVAANEIETQLTALISTLSPDDPVALETISVQIRAMFMAGKMPIEIDQQSREAYAQLASAGMADLPVAVRSSATAEDLPGLSFAGQQDTYLNIVGPESLIEAIKGCWSSLWTARAMGYRARNRISSSDVALAVVVQAMIPSEVSGVLFTANPVTGRRGEIVIDASFGLGESVVSGQVEPDHYVVNQQELTITAHKLGAKALVILPRTEGGTQHVSRDGSDQQALSDAQILALSRIAKQIATHFGSPQDIEWAWAGGQFYILQSRPITSLYPIPEALLHSEALRVFMSFNSAQGVVEPFTPLSRDIFPHLLEWILEDAGIKRDAHDILLIAGGRLYIDITALASDPGTRQAVLSVLANIDPGARRALIDLIETGRLPACPAVRNRTLLRLAWALRSMIIGMGWTWLRPESSATRAITRAERYLSRVRDSLNLAPTLEAQLALIDQTRPNVILKRLFVILVPAMAPGLLSQGIADRMLHDWLGIERGSVRRLLRGIPNNPTTEMDLRLWGTAQTIRSDTEAKAALLNQSVEKTVEAYQYGTLPSVAQKAIGAFLDQYGMRAVGEIDMGHPRWREDPRSIIQTLCSYLQIEDPERAPDRVFQTGAAESERLAAEYIAQVGQRKGKLRARLLGMVIRRMRLLSGLREMPKLYMVKIFDLFRTALLESGRDLVAQKKLDRPEDIFFVPLAALHSFVKDPTVDLKSIVSKQRDDHEHEMARRQIPRLLLSTGEVFYEGVASAGPNDLVGDGVSPGVIEGKVHVIRDPRGVRLEPGEILVCPATDPGWTPLFLSAGGLVMELGGMVTHGSVVAREYGIPAVVGVHQATTRLQTGQRVRIDGSAGRITVLK